MIVLHFHAGSFQNRDIIGPIHSDFRSVDGIEVFFAKNNRSERGKPPIEQKSSHATRSMLTRSSSTVAAA